MAQLPLGPAIAPRPASGDRIAVLRTHRLAYVSNARFIGTADVRDGHGGELEIRHRFVAPGGHEVAPAALPHLAVTRAWTDDRLGALMSRVLPIGDADYESIEAALRRVALSFGPAPSRPAHRRPRTPGRRRLVAARVLARRPPAR